MVKNEDIKKNRKYLKISEVSKLSGLSIPKIKNYIKNGLTPKPIKAGKTLAYYTYQHVERLKLIKDMQEEKVPTSILKGLIDSIDQIKTDLPDRKMREPETITDKMIESSPIIKKMIDSIVEIEGGSQNEQFNVSHMIRNEIIDSSISIFRKKGYERTTITNITTAAGIGRNTFYHYFKNKKELFVECLEKLCSEWVQKLPINEDDFFKNIRVRGIAFYENHWPKWYDMMSLYRVMAIKYPSDFADRYDAVWTDRLKPIVEYIENGIKCGEVREIDSELAAIMIYGAGDLLNYFISRGKLGGDASKIYDDFHDIWYHALKKE